MLKKNTLIVLCSVIINCLRAQCTAPTFTIDLSSATDTSWTLTSTARNGVCCGSSNCVTFVVKLNPASDLINFDVTNPSPSGSAFYQVNCGTPVSIGTPLCVVGLVSPFTITYCKPGGDHPDYKITASTIVHASSDISIQKTTCLDTLFVTNVQTSSITWTSIYPGATGAYNSYLSCTSACNSTIITPGTNPPPYIDFQVSGNPNVPCGSFSKDTVRVYFVSALTATITPTNPVICASSGTNVTLTANASGGAAPYNYAWSTGPHTQSITTSTAGTYTVTIGDNTKCPKLTFTKTITTLPSATFTFTMGAYCKNAANPNVTLTGTGATGVFSASPAGLSFVSTSTGQINLAASAVGTYTVTNTIAASGGCPGATATATVTINPYPTMTSASTATICTGNAVNIPLTSSMGSGYTWVASDNANTTGESITTQTTSTLNNTITNGVSTAQMVIYTVTPTANVSGGCTGTPQTVSVTVNPVDNAGFTYPSSTNCKTGTNPSPTITGLVGGTFSSGAGLVFVSSSSGTINLSASTIGSYTVTYTTNGSCPNTSTFPITVTTAPSSAFTYPATPYCQSAGNPSPTFSGSASGGTFTSNPAGLVFVNNLTGQVDLTASTPGTYTVTNTIAASGGCSVSTSTTTITITQLKAATFNYNSPFCQNASNPSPVFTGGGVAGTFTATAGLNITAGTGLVNLGTSTPGTYTVTNTIAATGGCPSVVATSTILITALPVATFTYPATPYCQNASNPSPTFIGGGVAGVFGASSVFLDINSGSGQVNLSNSTPDNYIITNTIGAANGCPAVTATASITITPLPIGTFNYTGNPYCKSGANPTPSLSLGGTNGIYTASPAGLSIDPNAGTINLSASTAGTYTVTNTIAAAGGCPAVAETATITITPLPVATFNYAATPYCQNGVDPSPTFTGGGVAGTFTAPAGLNINSSNGSVNLASSAIGSYTVTNTIAAANGCPAVVANNVIAINPVASVMAGSPATICSGSSYGLSGSISGGASSLTWTSSGSGSFSNNTSATATYAPSGADISAGTVTITITTDDPAGPCGAVSDALVLTINPIPVVGAGTNATICAGTTAALAGTSSGGTTSFTWTTSGSGTFNNISITNAVYTPSAADLTAGTVTLTITSNDPAGPCAAVTDDMVLTITPRDNAGFNYSSSTFCQTGANPSPTITGLAGGTFTASSPSLVINSSTGTVNLAASALGTYTVTYATNGSCPSAGTANITVTNAPSAVFNYTATPYCSSGNNPMPVFPVGSSGGTFTSSGGLTINSVSGQVTLSTSAPGTYTITNTIAAAGGCAVATATTAITIDQAATVTANTDQTICYGSNVTLAGAIGGSATSATWTGGTGSYSPNPATVGASYIPTSADSLAGAITLTLTTNDPAGVCPAVKDQMIVSINQPAVANANVDQQVCYGTNIILAGSVGGSATSGTWTGGAGSYTPDATTPGATYIPTSTDSAAGTVTLTLTSNDPAGVCPAVTDQMVITLKRPALAFANADQIICYGNMVTLSGAVGGSASSGTWSGGAGSFTPNSSILGANYIPTSTDSLAGTVTLTLTTNDPPGVCPAVNDQMTITINQPAVALANSDQTICYGSSVTLAGTIGGSAISGTWTGGTGAFSPDAITLNATYIPTSSDSTAGTVTLILTSNDPAGVCPSVNDQMIITINQPATADANANQTICYGSSVVLAGSVGGSATSGTWTDGTGSFTPNATTLGATYIPTTADSAAEVVILTLTTNDPAGVCPAVTDQMVISINQPALAFASVDQTICFGSPVPLSGAVGGSASDGTWSGGAGTFNPDQITLNTNYIPTSADSAAGTVTLTFATNDPASVCPAVADQMTIMFNQPAIALANASQTICYGSPVTLAGAIGGSATSGTWAGGAGSFAPNASILNATYIPTSSDSTAGVITLTLTTNDPTGVCPAVNDTTTITISQPAVAYANTDIFICFGGSVTLSGSVSGSATMGTWTGGTGSFTPNATTLNASYIPTLADSTAGSVTLTLTSDDPSGVCPAVKDSINIFMNQPPLAMAGADQTICYGNAVILGGSVGGSATIGTWTGGTGTFSPNATTLGASYIPTAADSAAGTVTLTLTTDDPIGFCTAVSDQIVISINQPAVAHANSDQTICYGSAVTLAGSLGGSATGGTWTGGTGTFSPNAITLGATYTPNAADSAAGSVTLTLTTNDPAGVCSAVNDQMVITIARPATANANVDQPVCYGNPVTLAGTVGGSATSGTWTGGTGTFSPNATTPGASYTPTSADSAAGNVTLTLTTNNPGTACTAISDQMIITIARPATANANVDQPVCFGNPVTLAGTVGGSATGGTWTGGTGTFSPGATITNATYTPNAVDSAAGSVTLILTTNDPAGVCPSVSDQMVISIMPPDNATFSYASAIMCQTTVNPTPIVTGLAGGSFTPSSPLLILNSSTGVVNAIASAPGTYTVTYLTNGMCPKDQTFTVSINSLPTANAGADSVLACGANSAVLNGSGSGSGVTYLWNSFGGNILSGSTGTNPVVSSTGLYYITVTDNKGCSASDTAMVTQGIINAAFTSNPTSGTAPLNVAFTNGSTGASTYTWTLGNGNSSFAINPSTSYTAGGTYSVTLIAQAGSCLDTAYATIIAGNDVNLIIPNVFTPNGDGMNDLFFITTTGVSEMHGDIFNRWGQLIYVLDGLAASWDGKNLQNNSSTDGTYYMILKYKSFDGKSYDKETYITLIR